MKGNRIRQYEMKWNVIKWNILEIKGNILQSKWNQMRGNETKWIKWNKCEEIKW